MLQEKISALYRTAYELLNLGLDGEPVYADRFNELNWNVRQQTVSLIHKRGSSTEEETALCVALLVAYKAMSFDYDGDREARIQTLLIRSMAVLKALPPSLLKCQLLLQYCGEVYEKELLDEAKEIIMSWGGRELSEEEKRMMEEYNNLLFLLS